MWKGRERKRSREEERVCVRRRWEGEKERGVKRKRVDRVCVERVGGRGRERGREKERVDRVCGEGGRERKR